MRNTTWCIFASGAVALAAAAGVAQGQTTCLASCVECSTESRCTAAPRDSVACDGTHGYGPGSAAYDVPSGRLFAEGSVNGYGPGSGRATLQDWFTASGPTTGAAIVLVARLHVLGYACGRSYFAGLRVILKQSDTNIVVSPVYLSTIYNRCRVVDTTFTLIIPATTGTPFPLVCQALAFGDQIAVASCAATLSFASQTSGVAAITSCNGFAQESPTPVLRASWGAVKSHWR